MEKSKSVKDLNNELIRTSQNLGSLTFEEDLEKINSAEVVLSEPTQELLKDHLDNEAYRKIHEIFAKTESLKKVAQIKNQEIQGQFQELRTRLTRSTQCLQRVRKEIDNVKFSYQQKVIDMQSTIDPGNFDPAKTTSQDIAKQMEDVQEKISKIRSQVNHHKQRNETVTKSYQEAFDNVTDILHHIDNGDYSSQKVDE